jgi:group II intron reverse transcriptase/maturase
MEPHERKTEGTQAPKTVSTKLARIAELARQGPAMAFRNLAHHIDVEFLREAFASTRKDGATGVDGQTALEYAQNLDANLRSLHERFKSGTYRAPPVKRVNIPKGDGRTRPIGIPTFEDKLLQRAVATVLSAVYEQDFLDCSFGFRPKRRAHEALARLRNELMEMRGGWILDVDIKGFFDNLDHSHLRDLLDQRVLDGVIRRTINKWLKAGVLEDGSLSFPDTGTPQGGVISPLLANVYLHVVVDKWFHDEVKPRLSGPEFLVRYADDFVMVFEHEADARRVFEVLPKRLARFGLTLHPEKSRLLKFTKPANKEKEPPDEPPASFDFLGFTHHWARSRRGLWVIKQKTAKGRLARALKRINEWCQLNRHRPLREQLQLLTAKLRGHCGYYGLTGNSRSLTRFRQGLLGRWRFWLNKRSHRTRMTWEKFSRLLDRYPLPQARAVHSTLLHAAKP